jgi:hypothetical protein
VHGVPGGVAEREDFARTACILAERERDLAHTFGLDHARACDLAHAVVFGQALDAQKLDRIAGGIRDQVRVV